MKKPKINDIEITSPVGSYESLMAAINAGAGSVYFGAGQMNMRSRSSKNFSPEDLRQIADICSSRGVRSYLAVNTVVYDDEIDEMRSIVQTAKESGISAIIASDLAVVQYANSLDMPVHISTQCNVSNIDAVKFYSQFADVIVLARELSLAKQAAICSAIDRENICGPSGSRLRIEVFAHGALCMSISGKCYLSLHEYNASANRGACLQNCRRKYLVKDQSDGTEMEIDNEYIMSPKDLCTIGFLDKIIEAGVSVLKIEGRGRPPEYVKITTECYNEAVRSYFEGTYSEEKVEFWLERLSTVFNRGFWDGYYLGQKLGEWNDSYGSKAAKKKVYVGKRTNYFPKIGVASFLVEDESIKKGDHAIIIGPNTGAMEMEIEEMRIDNEIVEKAGKGEEFSIPTELPVRSADKIYKLVDRQL